MLHPIYSTVLGHPELIADHLANYGALLQQEMHEASRNLISRVLAAVVAVVSALLALGLAGVAVMLGTLHDRFHWVLVVVPGIAAVIAIMAALIAVKLRTPHAFADLRAEFEADLHALHLAGELHER
jgi:hypothetical protein